MIWESAQVRQSLLFLQQIFSFLPWRENECTIHQTGPWTKTWSSWYWSTSKFKVHCTKVLICTPVQTVEALTLRTESWEATVPLLWTTSPSRYRGKRSMFWFWKCGVADCSFAGGCERFTGWDHCQGKGESGKSTSWKNLKAMACKGNRS